MLSFSQRADSEINAKTIDISVVVKSQANEFLIGFAPALLDGGFR